MLVADLVARIRSLQQNASPRHEADTELSRLVVAIARFEKLSAEQFVEKLTTMKVPKAKKTAAEKAAEAAEKERKAREKEIEKQLKAAQKAAEESRKAEEVAKQAAQTKKLVDTTVAELKALLARFRDGNVPKAVVDEQLEKLKTLKAPQLYLVAVELKSAAGLTAKTTKAKILKQLTEMVRRMWKTPDNVNH